MCTVNFWSLVLNALSFVALLVLLFVAIPRRLSKKKK